MIVRLTGKTPEQTLFKNWTIRSSETLPALSDQISVAVYADPKENVPLVKIGQRKNIELSCVRRISNTVALDKCQQESKIDGVNAHMKS